MTVFGWLLIFMTGVTSVTVPQPYSTKEYCEQAVHEALPNIPPDKYACVPIESPLSVLFPPSKPGER